MSVSKLTAGISVASMLTRCPTTPDEVAAADPETRDETARLLAEVLMGLWRDSRLPDKEIRGGEYVQRVAATAVPSWSCNCADARGRAGLENDRPCGHWLSAVAVEIRREGAS